MKRGNYYYNATAACKKQFKNAITDCFEKSFGNHRWVTELRNEILLQKWNWKKKNQSMVTLVSPHVQKGCKLISSTEAQHYTHTQSVNLYTDSVHLRANRAQL